jgi:hypothetical protein
MSHFERFFTFHKTFYREVEPLSVTPFAPGAVHRALTASLVSVVRHGSQPAWQPNPAARDVSPTSQEFANAAASIEQRSEAVADREQTDNVRIALSERGTEWANAITEAKRNGTPLLYVDRSNTAQELLHDYDGGDWTARHVPNSMRDVEAPVQVVLEPRKQWSKRSGAVASTASTEEDDHD